MVGGLAVGSSAPLARSADAPPVEKPSWAKTSSFQDEDASKRKIPVAREVDLGGGERLRFVWIPPGRFRMGSPATEEGRFDDEAQHEVELTQGFYLSIHEVTNGQYRRFKEDHDSGAYQGESLAGATQPAVMVSHEAATAYVGWLSGRGGNERYRLPTESEWEYACRAGTTTSRWWGEDESGARGRASVLGPSSKRKFDYSWESFSFDDGHHVTSPAGTFAANSWGLYDMLGNVWEWCSDWYGPYPTGVVRDPQGATSGDARVLRGGSWYDYPRRVRSADRGRYAPGNRYDNVGFRVVLLAPR